MINMKSLLLLGVCLCAVLAGAGTYEDSTARWRAATEGLANGGTLMLPKGEYHVGEAGARKLWLDPSNNKSGEKSVVFPLVGKSNVTINGNGSKLIVHGTAFPFAALGCTNVTVRNLSVTTRYPSCAGFTVLEKSPASFTVQFDGGVCPYTVADDGIDFRLDGHVISTRAGRLSLHSLDRLLIHYLMTPKSPGDKSHFPAPFVGAIPEDLGEGKVRFRYYGDSHAKSVKLPYNVGEKVVVNLEEQRYRDVFFFEDCVGVKLENVSIDRFGGMGVVAQRSGDFTIKRLRALPPEGERVSLTADILQFINCHGDIRIENCEGGFSLDDILNVHGNYLFVEQAGGRTLRLRVKHPSHEGFFPYRPGDVVEFVAAHTRDVLGSARVVGVARDPQDRFACTLTVDADVPSVVKTGALVENATLNPNVTIRGCRFRDYPNVRLSGRGTYLIEGNRFENGCSMVVGMDLADYWYESGRIADMTIRDNDIVNCGGCSFGLSGWRGNEPNLPKIHGRVLLENNRFVNPRGAKWFPAAVRDFTAR